MTPILRSRDGHFLDLYRRHPSVQRSKANVAKIIISDPKVETVEVMIFVTIVMYVCRCLYYPPKKKSKYLLIYSVYLSNNRV